MWVVFYNFRGYTMQLHVFEKVISKVVELSRYIVLCNQEVAVIKSSGNQPRYFVYLIVKRSQPASSVICPVFLNEAPITTVL